MNDIRELGAKLGIHSEEEWRLAKVFSNLIGFKSIRKYVEWGKHWHTAQRFDVDRSYYLERAKEFGFENIYDFLDWSFKSDEMQEIENKEKFKAQYGQEWEKAYQSEMASKLGFGENFSDYLKWVVKSSKQIRIRKKLIEKLRK